MRIMYAFVPHFECVTLINGAFNERPAALSYPSASPLYITLLPLRAILLPYTVRLIGGKVASNAELARSFEAGADRYIITFDERHNYVYSPRTPVTHPLTDPAERFFRAVKELPPTVLNDLKLLAKVKWCPYTDSNFTSSLYMQELKKIVSDYLNVPKGSEDFF